MRVGWAGGGRSRLGACRAARGRRWAPPAGDHRRSRRAAVSLRARAAIGGRRRCPRGRAPKSRSPLQAELGPAARERIRTRSRALGDGEGSGRLNQGTNEPRRVALSRRPVVLESTSVSWAILDLSAQHAGPGLISNR